MTHAGSWRHCRPAGLAGVVVLAGCAGQTSHPAWDGIAYVAMGPGEAVSVLDLGTGGVLPKVPLWVEPHGVALTPGGAPS